MNFKLVLKVYSQLRQLTDDESALLNTLRGMTDAEREMTVEAFGGSMGKQVSKSSTKLRQTRNIEHCEVCNWTRRAAVHKDTALKDYHEFQSSQSSAKPKSARASSIAEKVTKVGRDTNHKPLLCDYEIDGKVCHGTENDGIHDKSLGYGNHHPFVSSSTARNAAGQSSTSEQGQSSETGSADVSVAAGG